jgi:hypothetical protein
MPSRSEMIAALQQQDQAAAPAPAAASAAAPSREEMIKALQQADAAPAASEPGIGTTERAVRGVVDFVSPVVLPVARAVDRFTGAPVRAGIGALQDGQNPAMAAMNQFGSDPALAPTGKDIAKKAGFGEKPFSESMPSLYDKDGTGWKLRKGGLLDASPAGAVGLGVDAVSDPLNFVGAGEVLSVAKAGGKMGLKAAGKVVKGGSLFADAVTGTKAATTAVDATKSVANTSAKVMEAAKKSIDDLLKPTVAADAKELEAIATKHGIPKELIGPGHEFGERSSITRQQRNLAEGPLGEKYLDAHNSGIVKTSEALEKNVSIKFGHPPSTAADAGVVIKDAADAHISRVFDENEITYSSAVKKFPGLQVPEDAMSALKSKALGMKREAMRLERTSRAPQQLAQAKNLRDWTELILEKAEGPGNYKEMSETVQNIGRAAFEKTPVGMMPADVKKLRELYDVGREALIHSIRKADPAAADRLVMGNMEISEMLGEKSMLGKAITQAPAGKPEAIYDALIKRGGSEQIATLKKWLPESTYNQVRGKYLQDLIKYHSDDVSINFSATRRNLEKNSDRLRYLFKPEELKDMTELLHFGERYGSPVLSHSGTGGSQGFLNLPKKLLIGGQDEQALEYLKNKARGKVPAPAAAPAAGGAPGPAPTVPAAAAPGRAKFRGYSERGPGERRLKAAQTVAPSTYTRPSPTKPNVGREEPRQEEKQEAPPPAKGEDKWVNDGIEKLKEHGVDEEVLDEARANKKLRELLITASDLKPGSTAMKKLAERFA